MKVVIRCVVCLAAACAVSLLAISSANAQQRGLESRVDTLEAESAAIRELLITQRNKIAALEAAQRPQVVVVNCGADQSINAVLARYATQTAPLTIRVTGTCTETVNILRDSVTLQGVSGDDGIRAPSADVAAVSVSRRGVTVTHMRLEGGLGLAVSGAGAAVAAQNVLVTGAVTGLNVTFDAILSVQDSVIDGNGSGALVGRRGTLNVRNTQFRNNVTGIEVPSGRVHFSGTNVIEGTGSSAFGIRASIGAGIVLLGTTIRNHQVGAHVSNGAVAFLGAGTVIENNDRGVYATGGSSVELASATIRNNVGDGVRLGDVSVIAGAASSAITANGGWGLVCAPAPSVAQITAAPGGYSLNATHVFGNAMGQISCPGVP